MKENSQTPAFSELNEEDPEKQALQTPWKPYSDSKYEQPLCSCCCPFFFKYRWKILRPLQTYKIFSHYSLGFCIFFVFFLAISVYSIIITWDNVKSSAKVPTYLLQLTYLFPAKNSIWMFLTGVSQETFLFWHKYLSILCVITGIFHAIERIGPTGIILIISLILMQIFALECVRRRYFNFFFKSHWILGILTVFFSIMHKVHLYVVAALWIFDIILRMIIVWKNNKRTKNFEIEQVSENCMKISFDKAGFQYKAGQLFFLCCPKISVFEWHPFNVSSSPFQDKITIFIKVLGDWTKQLYEMSKTEKNIKMWLEGPFGGRSLSLDGDDEYQIFLLIGGGIGCAPLNSLCNNLMFEKENGRNLEKVFMIWSARDQKIMEGFMDHNSKIWRNNLGGLIKNGVWEIFYHLTRKEGNDRILSKNEFIEMQSGRPNLDDYFLKALTFAKEKGKKKIAVLSSGPLKMMEDVLDLGKKWSKDGVKFDCSVEINEY